MAGARLAGRYAKSLLDLAIEKNKLEETRNDMLFLGQLCKGNKDFAVMLRSPVIPAEKKDRVFDAVAKNHMGGLTNAFCKLLVRKGRESHLPDIAVEFIVQYKAHKGIYDLKLITATPISEELKQVIMDKVKEVTVMKKLELTTEVREDIVGGFILEAGDLIADASVAFDLHKIRKQFENNEYVYNIR